jgi:hypothetical protein
MARNHLLSMRPVSGLCKAKASPFSRHDLASTLLSIGLKSNITTNLTTLATLLLATAWGVKIRRIIAMKKYLASIAVTTLSVCAISSFTANSAFAADPLLSQTRSTRIDTSAIPLANSTRAQTDIYIVQFKEQPVINFEGSNFAAE